MAQQKILSSLSDAFGHERVTPVSALQFECEVERLAAEIAGRHLQALSQFSPQFLVIFGLQRARMFRKVDGEYSPSDNAKRLLSVLRDGPDCGVHTICWCDTYDSLQRTVDHAVLQSIDMLVAIQMNNDSSMKVVGNNSATTLSPNRALFIDRGTGGIEKFRPYRAPSLDWINSMAQSGSPDPDDVSAIVPPPRPR